MRGAILTVILGLLLSACGGGEPTPPPPEDADDFPGSDQPELVEHAETARADLAQQLEVEENQVDIVLAERLTWNSGALGCPEEGMSYTQALVDGYRIEMEYDGEPYHYHGEEGKPPFYCADPPDDQTGARTGDS